MPAYPPLVPEDCDCREHGPLLPLWTWLGKGSVLWSAPKDCCCSPAGRLLWKAWLSASSLPCPSCAHGHQMPVAPGVYQCSGTSGCPRLGLQQSSPKQWHTGTSPLSPAARWSRQRSPLNCPPGAVLVAEPAVISPGKKTSPLAPAVKLSAWVVPCWWLVMLTAAESAPALSTAPVFTADQSSWAGLCVARPASTSLNQPAKPQQWSRKG